ncbi:MAG: L-threonylcarbamoyladenylate synthase [Pseudanabaenaceae cyanobacterium SKYGB_i_bin29]|nr:L-threonylcarbamoyladenylate synthase [Pseudanabaenaceae cyanobacterium SKYG29]MDW8421942.1 L-threonylcarbamoyladenylate synthase [Pseudanabaenaceae cyanobacterium SKYGB_i_bin29]
MPLVNTPSLIALARSGFVVSFPTDTVPALAVLPGQGEQIYRLKQRPQHKPLILMAATWTELQPYLEGRHPAWEKAVSDYLPGALTIVLPASPLGRSLNQTDTIGIRIPAFPIALNILQQTGPLLTTSANLSGTDPLPSMRAIAATFPSVFAWGEGEPDRVFGSGKPSTVVKWEQNQWQILRQGEVKLAEQTTEIDG